MAEQPQSKSLRDYASFELERKGYHRAQVDAFLAELDQAFIELETSVKERGDELAELQQEVERLKRESPIGRSEELQRRAELNAEQMLASSLSESQEIISKAEAIAMRIIANARAQSQEIASQPAGFGMLARVRTIAADIDRMKAEHAALMDDAPEQLELSAPEAAASEELVEADAMTAAGTTADPSDQPVALAEQPAAKKKPAAKPKATQAKKPAAKKKAPSTASTAKAEPNDAAEAEDETVEVAPRIQLVEPAPPPKVAPIIETADEEFDDEVVVDTKNFDWSMARAQVKELDDGGPRDPLAVTDDSADDDGTDDQTKLPTIMRRQGSRYERHSASLPKIGNEGESTLSDVAKVSRRRRRRAAAPDDDSR